VIRFEDSKNLRFLKNTSKARVKAKENDKSTFFENSVHSRHKIATGFTRTGFGDGETIFVLESRRPGHRLNGRGFSETRLLEGVSEGFL